MTAGRVLFFARNRRGLGHLMRVRNLATAVRTHVPTFDVHVHATRRPPPELWDSDIALTTDEHSSWATIVERFRPCTVVHDTTLASIDEIDRHAPGRLRHVLVMRRRTQDRHRDLMADPALAAVARFIVPHHPDEFGLELPPSVRERTTFVGPITRSPGASPSTVRARYGVGADAFLLTVTVGGGGFADQADRFFEFAGSIVPAVVESRSDAVCVIVLGPNYGNTVVADRLAALPSTVVVPFAHDLVDLVAASDLVVAEGGYNTVLEVQVAQVPAVFVPSPRNIDDQFERVERAAMAGSAIVIDPATDPSEAAARVGRLVGSPGALDRMRYGARVHRVEPGNQRAAAVIAEVAT
jgi:Glycosyltransferase family 28 C-terminal domain